jgi:hypothetical protein
VGGNVRIGLWKKGLGTMVRQRGSQAKKYYLSLKWPNHCAVLEHPFEYLIKDQLL